MSIESFDQVGKPLMELSYKVAECLMDIFTSMKFPGRIRVAQEL